MNEFFFVVVHVKKTEYTVALLNDLQCLNASSSEHK